MNPYLTLDAAYKFRRNIMYKIELLQAKYIQKKIDKYTFTSAVDGYCFMLYLIENDKITSQRRNKIDVYV